MNGIAGFTIRTIPVTALALVLLGSGSVLAQAPTTGNAASPAQGPAPAPAATPTSGPPEAMPLPPTPAPAAPATLVAPQGAMPVAPNAEVGASLQPFPMASNGNAPVPYPTASPHLRQTTPRVIAVESPEPESPPSPPKTRYPFGLSFDLMPVWQTSKGFDLFSSNDLSTRIGLTLDVEVAEVAASTWLAIEGGWSTESQGDPNFFGPFATDFVAQNFHGGVRLKHQVLHFLAPHVRLGAGATSMRNRFSTETAVFGDFESHQWLAFGMIGGGVTAAIPTQALVQPGLLIEGGYLLSGSMPLRLEPTADENRMATSGATLGVLERSGPYLRFGLFIRY